MKTIVSTLSHEPGKLTTSSRWYTGRQQRASRRKLVISHLSERQQFRRPTHRWSDRFEGTFLMVCIVALHRQLLLGADVRGT
jgi:hypothetical protein